MSALEHGTAILINTTGILIRGPSGSGKSSLALQMIQMGACLIADDQVFLSARNEQLIAATPSTIAGKIEIFGQGIMSLPHERQAIIRLVADLDEPLNIPRMPAPEDRVSTILGVRLDRIILPSRSALSADLLLAAINRKSTS